MKCKHNLIWKWSLEAVPSYYLPLNKSSPPLTEVLQTSRCVLGCAVFKPLLITVATAPPHIKKINGDIRWLHLLSRLKHCICKLWLAVFEWYKIWHRCVDVWYRKKYHRHQIKANERRTCTYSRCDSSNFWVVKRLSLRQQNSRIIPPVLRRNPGGWESLCGNAWHANL